MSEHLTRLYLTAMAALDRRLQRDQRGISTIVEILAACLLIILVYAAIKTDVENGVKDVVASVFEKLTSAA